VSFALSLLGLAPFGIAGQSTPSPAHAGRQVLISKIHSKPGKRADIEQLIREFYAEVRRKEPGCLINVMHRPAPQSGKSAAGNFTSSEADADTLIFYEVYRDAAAGRRHPTTPHFAQMMTRLQDLMTAPIELQFLEIVAEK